jgi:hypothetical protein
MGARAETTDCRGLNFLGIQLRNKRDAPNILFLYVINNEDGKRNHRPVANTELN